ncbi:PEP-CTERM sorting domain-containing protein [Undibacterium sp.]|jgi:hypothetical protein|uniref:PEP-CTERM sorting domain-containing protein n=1 Tax=Undibacterium sp. TaxID=1914977 RepID=UPI002B86262B|nr:PEP-CTERM sorting domain-containing protein [Undibacterium sp.]HTD04689.1 PEP-CTERM sorting domain-containing protein [Undibacterium sp.]
MLKKLIGVCCILAGALAMDANASFYNPFGPQQNVSQSVITNGGWTQCYAGTMNLYIGNSAENVLSQCQGTYLMMAGRATGSDVFQLLAETTFADATFNTETGTQNTHNSNGSDWYFASNWSWGFTGAGEAVNLNQCDVSGGADKMCLHTINGAGGYRIGDNMGLNDSTSFEKVFFVSNGAVDLPEPATLAMLGLGLAGICAARRKAIK